MSKRVVNGVAVKAIRALRAEHDPAFKQARFAVTCLISPAHLCNVEKGEKGVSEDVLRRLALALGVPVEAISYTVSLEAVA